MQEIREEELIELVKQHPALYDLCNVNYYNQFRKDIIWEEIGDKLDSPADDCRKKWASLRDGYRKWMKRSAQSNGKVKTWHREKEMRFMREYMGDRKKIKCEDSDEEAFDAAEKEESSSKTKLYNIDEGRLIDLVKAQPMLYDPRDSHYHNPVSREKAWECIGKILNSEVEDCRLKWRALRDCYRKSIRNRAKSLQAGKPMKRWRLDRQMTFMKDFLRSDKFLKLPDDIEDLDYDCSEPYSPFHVDVSAPEINDHREDLNDTLNVKHNDHLSKYFEAAEETLRTFPTELQIEAKRRISEVIHEYEMIAFKRKCNTDGDE